MVRPAVVTAVALALVLSGCVGTVEPGAVGHEWSGALENPWQQSVLTVSYAAEDHDRDYEPLVVRSLEYWSEHSEQHAGYDVDFRLAATGESADVHVEFVEEIGDCDGHGGEHAAGCAPVVTESGHAERPVDVAVRRGLDDESTVRVLKHELGHTLGLEHGEGPGEVMDATMELYTLPQPNATERAVPWRSDDLLVYTDLAGAAAPESAERQVDAAIHYYADGADGTVPSNVTFSRTDSPDDADVVVRYPHDADCRSDSGSCGSIRGVDLDGDGALERHDRLEVVLVDLDTEAVGWHVGRWLGAGFGHEADDYPEPLQQSAGYDDRRSHWWD